MSSGYVYLISSNIEGITYYKIGKTKRDPSLRRDELNTGNQVELVIEDTYYCKWYHTLEQMLHAHFRVLRSNGEWFINESGNFKLNVDEFRKVCKKCTETIEFMLKNNEFFARTLK